MIDDALSRLQDWVTKTASFASAALNLVTGTPATGLRVRVIYRAAGNTSGSNTATFSIEHSPDNSTWYSCASGDPLTLTSTPQGGEQLFWFRTELPYVRLALTIGGAGSTPTITYQAYLRV